ncbi:MAG TPA: EAL domain-containing response regulator [Burkholderiaceae bacterium]|nr:EAL domain-containing response regulator [Burkholderiaceae bacterium]
MVEPQQVQRQAAVALLRSLGLSRLAQAEDGEQALVWARERGGRGLVLFDLDMPKVDGMAFIRQLALVESQIAIAICSAHDPDLLRAVRLFAQNLRVNLVALLRKPLERDDVERAVARACVQETSSAAPAVPHALCVAELRDALDAGWLRPFFQPKVRLADGQAIGCESLVRIVHPERGVLLPAEFLPAMIDGGLELDVAAHVFDGAAQLLRRLGGAYGDFRVAVNVSVPLVESVEACTCLLDLLEVHGVPLSRLVLEVTEDAAAMHASAAVENLARLRMRGVRLSIDDFGTGYSSLDQLQRLPFSELKLERSFVRAATLDGTTRTMVEATLAMAQRLGLSTVAEGIETPEEAELMRSLGCQVGQGFLYAPALTAHQLVRWLVRQEAREAA